MQASIEAITRITRILQLTVIGLALSSSHSLRAQDLYPALKALDEVAVRVSSDPDLARFGLDSASVQTEIEARIKLAGIKVADYSKLTWPTVEVLFEFRLLGPNRALFYEIQLLLTEPANVVRSHAPALVATYSVRNFDVVVNTTHLQDEVRSHIEALLDEFVKDLFYERTQGKPLRHCQRQ